MSVFKGLNRSDVYLTDYNSRKLWYATGSNLAELGIKFMVALSSSRPYLPVDEDLKEYKTASGSASWPSGSLYNQKLAYFSLTSQYYEGSLGDGTFTGSRNWCLPSSLTLTGSRVISEEVYRGPETEDLPEHQINYEIPGFVVLKVPKEVFGLGISPGTLKVNLDKDQYCYVEDDYLEHEEGSFCDEGYPIGSYTRDRDHWVDPYFENLHTPLVFDFEGLLMYNGFTGKWHQPEEYKYPTPVLTSNKVVGDVLYAQGQIIFTDSFLRFLLSRWDIDNLQWESNKPIFTEHVTCKVRDIDFNRTLNRTATEELQNTPGFTPYVTTVGLYNTAGDLIAVAKLSRPIKKALDTEITFDIQIDLG